MKSFILNQVQVHSNQMPDAGGNEKFMVVIAVVLIIFLGIVAYLFSLDRKLKKLEKKS